MAHVVVFARGRDSRSLSPPEKSEDKTKKVRVAFHEVASLEPLPLKNPPRRRYPRQSSMTRAEPLTPTPHPERPHLDP